MDVSEGNTASNFRIKERGGCNQEESNNLSNVKRHHRVNLELMLILLGLRFLTAVSVSSSSPYPQLPAATANHQSQLIAATAPPSPIALLSHIRNCPGAQFLYFSSYFSEFLLGTYSRLRLNRFLHARLIPFCLLRLLSDRQDGSRYICHEMALFSVCVLVPG
jgi:hypothetical protein